MFADCRGTSSTGIKDAQANGYVASFKRNPEAKMGYVQAAYGTSME
jgi:hypothetical protein